MITNKFLFFIILYLLIILIYLCKSESKENFNFRKNIIYYHSDNLKKTKNINKNYLKYIDSLKNSKNIYFSKYKNSINIKNKTIIFDFSNGFSVESNPTIEEMNHVLLNKNQPKKKIIILHDLHIPRSFNKNIGSKKNVINFIKKYNFKFICYGYASDTYEHKFFKENNIKYKNLIHHINSNIFKNYHIPKTYEIIIYGASNKKSYPFRNRLSKLLPKYFNVIIIEDLLAGGLKPKELAKMINKSILGVATPSKYNYFLQKYLEIPFCNCGLLGNLPKSQKIKEIYKNNYTEILPEMKDEEIINVIKKALINKKEIEIKKENLYNDVKKYNFNNFSDNFIKTIESI